MIVVAYIVCAIVWGTTWFAIRLSIGPGAFPTIQSAAMRFTIAGSILFALWLFGLARPRPRRAHLEPLVFAGLINGVGYALVYTAEESVPGALAAVLFGTYPLITAGLAVVTRTERVALHQIVGALVALAGIAIVFSDRLSVSSDQALGVVFLLCAVTCSGGYGVIIKRRAGDLHPLATAAVFLSVSAVALWVAAPFFAPVTVAWPPPRTASLAVLYLAVFGSVISFGSYFYLLSKVSLMTTTTLVFAQPLIALSVDAAFEQDALGATTYIGMAVVLFGVLISLALGQRHRRKTR